jgi:hypothetical protein
VKFLGKSPINLRRPYQPAKALSTCEETRI